MHDTDLNKVVFHSKEDLAGGHYLQKGEHILRGDTKSKYSDINEVLELYNLKKYIDNELYLRNWTQEDIENFNKKAKEYERVVGQFMASINDDNFINLYDRTLQNFVHSFWELINNQGVFKRISKSNFTKILTNEPHLINEIITHKKLVGHYDLVIRNFLLTYPQSAEILLSIYEAHDFFSRSSKFIPKSLTIQDKENIISNYLDSKATNLNYIELILNTRNSNEFKISDKTRLKAKRLHKIETEKILSQNTVKYGVSISFPDKVTKIKDGFVDENLIAHYSYSLDFIKQHNDYYSLFRNFKLLFEYVDIQNRINLVSKKSQLGTFEKIIGIRSQNEYITGTSFSLSEMTSQSQIVGYSNILNDLDISLESVLNFVFTSAFQEKYDFASNARFYNPTLTNPYFEKVRLLAPEFESILKQFKLFVEEGYIDFELLQISSTPSSIKDIPSLNKNKYLYLNEDNNQMLSCSNLFFSDQTLLSFVKPFKEKQYHTFFNLLINEPEVKYNNYEEFQRPELKFLIDMGLISIDSNDNIQVKNFERLLILKDLYENEFASFYRYSLNWQAEIKKMAEDNVVFFESSLFSRPEQSYFNYFLNKSEFTNGLDLRNSYLHGTQANPDETWKHENAYFTYLKLLVLTMLKIEDDLFISKRICNKS